MAREAIVAGLTAGHIVEKVTPVITTRVITTGVITTRATVELYQQAKK